MEHGNGPSPSAPYVGWTPFKTCVLEGLTHGGLPNTINRSVFSGQSGGVQGQLLNALKFLGLTDDKGKPTKALEGLVVDDEEARKRALCDVLRSSYPEVFALGIDRTTLPELGETIAASYGISGETREKAARFFISAAQHAGLQLSQYIVKGGAAANGRRKARRARTADPVPTSTTATPTTTPTVAPAATSTSGFSTGGSQHTIQLTSGGSVTVIVSLDVFKLSQEDRTFVFGLIDKLTEYEREAQIEDEDEDANPFGARPSR